jgi:ribonuclease P/MRP protein subunit POP1
MWNSIKDASSPASLSPGMVLSLTIRDPRLTFPRFVPHRDSLSSTDPNLQSILATALSPDLAISSIWDTVIRKGVTEMKRTEASINDEKSKLVVPGPVKDSTRIPILLVQRGLSITTPSSSSLLNTKSEYENGWSIIFPKAWSKPLWRSLVFAGAKPMSIACVDNSIMYQAGIPRFPRDFVGTRMGIDDAKKRDLERRDEIERKPPAKRGFKVVKEGEGDWPGRFMFKGDLPRVVETVSGMTCETDEDVRVIYSSGLLAQIKNRVAGDYKTWSEFIGDLPVGEDCLVPVSIETVDGMPLDDAAVYVIESQDVYDRFDGKQELLKRSPVAETEWTEAQLDWYPESDVGGYVTSGGYSLALGKGFAFATVSLKKIFEAGVMFGKRGSGGRQWVLVRNRNGRRCRMGMLEILS